jgi:phosphohistidine phosphatase
MKSLIVVRHAKSSWKDISLPDRRRPLNKRGKRDAPEMGERLARRALQVDRIISSPATRALKTARLMAEKLAHPKKQIITDDRIYPGDSEELLAVIHDFDDKLRKVMLFGHNPGLTELVNRLGAKGIENVPTCGVVEMRFDVDRWEEIGRTKATAFTFDYPKKIREAEE